MRLPAALLCLVVWGLSAAFIYDHWQDKQQQRLSESSIVLGTTYRASVAMYRLATETLVTELVQRPEILATFAEGVQGTGAARNAARGRLYRLLYPTYTQLEEHDVHQFQFHTPDGRSFLRFHAPDKFDDPLADVRPTIRLVVDERRPAVGFEIGRLVAGFRYVYPLFQEGRHLGSVETTVTFRAISRAMDGIDPGREYQLLLRKSAVDRVMFDEPRRIYAEASLNDDFLSEDPRLRLPGAPPPPSEQVQALDRQLATDPAVKENMAAARIFALGLVSGGDDWAVSFVPVADIAGENVAYVISYARAPFLAVLRHEFLLYLGFSTLALGGLFWLSLRLLMAHAILREEKSQLQTITDTIADGLYVMDRQGRITRINPAFSQLLGYSGPEVIGRIGHDLFHVHADGSDLPLARCPIVAATSAGTEYVGEEMFRHSNGRLLTVEISCKPILKEEHLSGSVTAFRDITERKAAEKRLLESDRIKSEFIATASHELRTPLAVIQGYAELLRESEGLGAEQVREFEAIIYDKAVALEKIIDDLLDVSRIESGRPVCLDLMTLDISHEIRQVVDQFRKEASHHRFSLSLPSAPVPLSGDKFKLAQVLENLLNNAVKFSPAGSEILVMGEVRDGRFQVTVADEGIGIEPESLKYIFDKFYRVDASNTAASGFGLGLYLVKRIVEAHQGEIRVESTPGRGTTFVLTLPLGQGEVR